MHRVIASNLVVCYTENMLELLAPAGDREAFDVAIASGADAVYLGLDNFNARMKAQNFDCDNIAEVVAYAHFYGVKVYVTINTILQNQEFSELISLVKVAVDAKVDAFLVQDLGVCKVLKETFDGIVLHASTQLGVHNLLGAQMAQKAGFSRVVLSRETKLEDIKAIKQNTDLEIEYFVQGALCVAFSGNCYLSAKEQNASGNRGLCKQLCRLPYRAAVGGKTYDGYLLSARDLCLYSSIKELADAGVCSFKIEGRLRRKGYVACAVQTYRKAIDEAEKGNSVRLDDKSKSMLKTAFSRGEYLERAYLDEGTPKAIEKRFNNHVGVKIGAVRSVKEFKDGLFEIVVATKYPLAKGDGLKFFDGDKEKASLGIGEPKACGIGAYSFVTKTKVKVGWQVNLILDARLDEEILRVQRSVPIRLEVVAKVGLPLAIKAIFDKDGKQIEVEKHTEQCLEKALNAPMSANDVAAACSKVGDSGFEVERCDVSTDGVFVAKSVVNALRRDVLKELKEKIVLSNAPQKVVFSKEKADEFATLLAGVKDVDKCNVHVVKSENLSSKLVRHGEKFLLKPDVYSAQNIRKTLDLFGIGIDDVILDLPIYASGKDLKVLEAAIAESGVKRLASENIYGLYFSKKGFEVVCGQGHNIANVFAVHMTKDLGASAYVPSCEYKDFFADECLLRLATDEDVPLMAFAHCPYKTIFDCECASCAYKPNLVISRENRKYAVRRVRLATCRFELYPLD